MPALIITLLLSLLIPFNVFAETVTTTGTASVRQQRYDLARRLAIEQGLQEAVRQIAGSFIESQTLVKQNILVADEVYAHSQGYVESYKILGERRAKDSMKVDLQVEVSKGQLLDKLDSLGLLIGRKGYPRLYFKPDEKKSSRLLAGHLGQRFKQCGFFVVSSPQLADLIVDVQASFTHGSYSYRGNPIHYNELSLQAQVSNRHTHDLIISFSLQGKTPGLAQFEAQQQLAESMSDKASHKLQQEILHQWQQELGQGKILLFFRNVKSYDQLLDLKEFLLAQVPGMQQAHLRDFIHGTGLLEVFYTTSQEDLLQELTTLTFNSCYFNLIQVQPGTATIHLKRR